MSQAAVKTQNLAEALLAALGKVLPPGGGPYPLHEPEFAGEEWTYLKDCLDSGWVSSVGAYVDRFERDLAAITGAKRAIATVNGTSALQLCLIGAGVEAEEEVIVPALTFVATANAVSHVGAIPHFADAEDSSLGLDPDKLRAHLEAIAWKGPEGPVNRETDRRIAALLVTHVLGLPANVDALKALAEEWKLPLVEDAAEALGTRLDGRHLGHEGLAGALSFNGNKLVTTGGGGAVLTDDEALADRLKHLSTTAKTPHAWRFDHDAVGYNFRLPNLNAALGCAQLQRLEAMLAAKRRLSEAYAEALAGIEGITFLADAEGSRSNRWLNAILLDQPDMALRDKLLTVLHEAGILARPAWTLMHRLPMYRDKPRMDLTSAAEIEARLICLPSSAGLAPA